MHPMIKPALRRGWRDRQTVQYGVAPSHAVLLGPVDDSTAAFLDLLDGTRSMDRLRGEAVALGLPPEAADKLTSRLAAAGVLDDATAHRREAGRIGDRLRADLASLSAVHPAPGAGPRRLAARRTARVRVRGAGRVGAAVASVLSAAGVGRVDVVDGGHVEPWETLPGGIPSERQGERRDVAAQRTANGALPWRRRPTPGETRDTDGTALVVVAPRDGLDAYAPDPDVAERFVRAGTPHLYGGVIEGMGVVGPLVLPGSTPCGGCILLSRAERDPSWPLLVGQWRAGRRRKGGVGACDAALATMVAGAIASYALSFVDGDGNCAAGYRVGLALPYLLPETERLEPHRECGCGAASVNEHPPPSAATPTQVTMAS